jgi:hypothetical protein
MYQAPGSPLSIGGVLDSGFKLFRECFTRVFFFALASSLITAPANYAGAFIGAGGASPGLIAAVFGGGFVVVVIAIVLSSAMIVRIDSIARGEVASVGDALRIGAQRAPAMLGATVLMGLAVVAIPSVLVLAGLLAGASLPVLVGFSVLLLIPCSIIAIWLIFGPYAAILDRLGPVTSLRYSRALTRGYWWRTTALITILVIVLAVLSMVVGIVVGIAAFSDPEALVTTGQLPWYIQFVVSPVLSAFLAPLSYSLFMAIYYDLKLRHEGGDLAARIAGTA